MSDTDKTFKNIAEIRERGIPVLPPDVNESREDFTVLAAAAPGGLRPIRFGLGAVRGVGGKAVEGMIVAREAEGPFRSLADFCRRTQGAQVNKKVAESLVKCGAFDSFGVPRWRLLEGLERAMQWGAAEARQREANQMGLFMAANGTGALSPEPPLPEVAPWPDKERLKAERDAIGFYITAHPLDKYEADLKRVTSVSIQQLRGWSESGKATVGGVIQGLRLRNSKKGDRYASFTLEDKTGVLEVICWPEAYKRCETLLTTDDPVCVSGTVEISEERSQVIADEVVPLVTAREKVVQQVHFALRADRVDDKLLVSLRQTLSEHRGHCHAFLHLLLPNRTETVIALPSNLRVAATEGMVDAVERIFGSGVTSFQ